MLHSGVIFYDEYFFRYNSSADNALFEMKEYRRDVFVEINGSFYHIEVTTQLRFIQDLEETLKHCKGYASDIEQVIVQSMSHSDMIPGILDGCDGFTEKLIPCKTENGRIQYPLSETQYQLYMEAGWETEVSIKDLVKIYPPE